MKIHNYLRKDQYQHNKVSNLLWGFGFSPRRSFHPWPSWTVAAAYPHNGGVKGLRPQKSHSAMPLTCHHKWEVHVFIPIAYVYLPIVGTLIVSAPFSKVQLDLRV